MKVSFLKPNSIAPNGDYTQTCGKEQTGTILKQAELYEILEACKYVYKAHAKHQNGSIFPYINRTLGRETWDDANGLNDGVVFLDIDNITKDTAEKIYDSFEKLCEKFPCLYAIQYSSSYYLNDTKAGLHIYVASSILDEFEYNYIASLSLMIFARVVYMVLGIDLRTPQINDAIILDSHNTNITQRFFLYHSPYKMNEYNEIITEAIVKDDELKMLKLEYPFIRLSKTRHIGSRINLDLKDAHSNNSRLYIDRNFSIGVYSGNDVRWRISRIAQAIFGDNAQEWCDRYFYCENDKSIYTKQTSTKGISSVVKSWLEESGYLTSTKENYIKQGEYVVKYKDTILEFIEKHKRAEIVAPTGVGKTTLINGQKDYRVDLFNTNSDLSFSLAHELNAIVIVPFNVTNKLYDNMVEVSSENTNTIDPNAPAVMIWDQALKHWGEIKNRHFIIDEAHCLFLDRRYRDTAVQLMKKLKEDDCTYTLFTATPSGEAEELDCDYIKFYNERDSIKADVVLVNSVDVMEYKTIVNALRNNWYDRIVLFDDTTAKKIYEKLYCEGEFIDDIAYIRADTKNSEDFKHLRDNEYLEKKLTICTCVAFNGLNFKNKDENILVVTSFSEGNTTASEIIQEAGRIRNSSVKLKIFYDGKVRDNKLDEHIEKADTLHNIEIMFGIPQGLLVYNSRLIDEDTRNALRKIQEHINRHSNIEVIIEELLNTGYFIINKIDLSNPNEKKGNKMALALKRTESNEFIQDLLDNSVLHKEYDTNYKMDWQHQMKRMIENDTYIGISLDTFKEFYNNTDKKTLISTILQKIQKAIKISLIDEDTWNRYVDNVENIKKIVRNNEVLIKEITTSYKQNTQIRRKYAGKIQLKENNMIDLSLVFDDMIFELAEQYKQSNSLKSESKKKAITISEHFKHPEKYNLTIGQEFESCTELANYTHKSIQYISKWNKKEWIK